MAGEAQSFTLTIERAWKRLMGTMAKDNVARAQNMNAAQRGILRLMARR